MRIFSFSSISSIWEYILPEAVFLNSLSKSGHKIDYLNCIHMFDDYTEYTNLAGSGFTCLDKYSLRKKVFEKGKRNYEIIRKNFDFNYLNYQDFYDPHKAEKTCERILSTVKKNNFEDLYIDGIDIGKIAFADLLLHYKITTVTEHTIDDEMWIVYKSILKSVLKVYQLLNTVFSSQKIDRVVIYISEYPINLIAKKLSIKHEIPCYQIVTGRNWSKPHRTLQLSKFDGFEYAFSLIKNWEKVKSIAAEEQDISEVINHMISLLRGRFKLCYSRPKAKHHLDMHQFFNIRPGSKIFLAAMSSADEWFAYNYSAAVRVQDFNNDHVFKTQHDWIAALISYFRERHNYHLIIRIHPRDFPNQREGLLSEQGRSLKKILVNLPENVSINWPDQNVSFYDLVDYIDVGLTAHSSVGVEMMIYGVPCVSFNSNFLTYPSDLHYSGDDHQSYFRSIEDALRDGWSTKHIITAIRWYAIFLSKAVIDLESALPPKTENKSKFMPKIFYKVAHRILFDYRPFIECRKLKVLDDENSSKINKTIELNLETPFQIYDPDLLAKNQNLNEHQDIKNHLIRMLALFDVKEKNLLKIQNWVTS